MTHAELQISIEALRAAKIGDQRRMSKKEAQQSNILRLFGELGIREVIHELLLSFAEAGANVLRLKGGGFLEPAFFLTQLSHINSPVMAVLCMACSQGTNAFSQFGLYSNHQDIAPRYSMGLIFSGEKICLILISWTKLLLFRAYFAVSLLCVVTELLDNPKQDPLRILGCQTLTRFIYSQTDGTYTHTIESLVHRVCKLARESGEDHQRRCLRASSLQRLSAMVQFMAKFSYIFVDFDEIVHVTLDNYEPDTHIEDDERGEPHHNWVDEVVRSEGRVGVVGAD
ncbi:unnamed protein product [Prunus armeniaca]|uniref:Uncharacterized protein n=1 Tax=Prunus armeniaca TaxID=36596 RepID=A0A6J5WS47_PRUAR|nr:unnamed protein product [Prunus armeniaca]